MSLKRCQSRESHRINCESGSPFYMEDGHVLGQLLLATGAQFGDSALTFPGPGHCGRVSLLLVHFSPRLAIILDTSSSLAVSS